jgi:hypothetical protein
MPAVDQFFPYLHEAQYRLLLMPLGVRKTDGVTITADGRLEAKFGFVNAETPLTNIVYTMITGDHRWIRAVGLRGSLADSGVTFGTSPKQGLCIMFSEKIPRILGLRPHRALWVSVADPLGLAEAIGAEIKT